MRAPLSWLRDFAPFSDDADSLAAALSNLGLVVESIERVGEGLGDVVVARVLATRAHPDADRVQLVDVDVGDGQQLQVVCGAFNFGAGDLVPLARPGTTLPNGMEIGRRQVRGQWSDGMLCSGKELGLNEDHSGIYTLPNDGVGPGAPVTTALGIEPDVVFDLDVTPNRPDALSMVGVARDLAAHLKVPFTLPDWERPLGASTATITVKARQLCPRFTAQVLDGVRVGPSPRWLTARLTLAGMRPISNLVDVSNYVMLELGHPNHPYDLARLGGGGLLVRQGAKKGEVVRTLDDVDRTVGRDDCVICDADGNPVGIGGVMGGASSEIADDTTTVLLETAWFDPVAIARTAKRVGLRTEASVRFERGVDPEGIERAVGRFCQLAADVAGASPAGGMVDVRARAPRRHRPQLRTKRVNEVLGTALSADDIRGYLEPIGFECSPARAGWWVSIPTWRPDSTHEIDVIEEVARHHGYANIPRRLPSAPHRGGLTERQRDRRRVREILTGAGVSEAWTTSFLAPDDLARAGLPTASVEVENPLAKEESRLRTSLLPGLLRALALNAHHRYPDVALFEMGHVFLPPGRGEERPPEPEHLGVVLAGQDAAAAKRVWDVVADGLRLVDVTFARAEVPGLHPTRTMHVKVDGDVIATVGEVDPVVVAGFGLDGRVGWIEADVDRLLAAPRAGRMYRAVSRYPSADIDLAFVVGDDVASADVENTLREAAGALLVDVGLFDVFRGPQFGEGRRSLAFRLRFQADDHTLTDDEVADVRRRCVDAVERAHRGELRS